MSKCVKCWSEVNTFSPNKSFCSKKCEGSGDTVDYLKNMFWIKN